MSNNKSQPKAGSAEYYEATRKIFELESAVLTAVLPHAGERGANDEERCKAFLSKVLPRRYSIGTGFVVSSDKTKPISPQQDIVIYDDLLNAPLHRELSASVFPIETVYATVEVKGRLRQSDLRPTLESIGQTRQLSMQCYYQQFVTPNEKAGRAAELIEYAVKKPPRAFVFAYDTGYKSLPTFKKAWERTIAEVRTAHLHGVVVLSRDWYAFQVPYKTPPEVRVFSDHALMRFTSGMLNLLRATKIREAAMDRYLDIEVPTPDSDTEWVQKPKK